MQQEHFEKVIIYPTAQFVPPEETTGRDLRLVPLQFPWLNRTGLCIVTVDEVLERGRAPARRAGGHGFLYTCRVSWFSHGTTYTKTSKMWFDPRRLQWFVEVSPKHLWEGWQEDFKRLGTPPTERRPRNGTVVGMEGAIVQEQIYPRVRFMPPDEKTKKDYRLVPEQYEWQSPAGPVQIRVDTVTGMMRATSLKYTRRGYRYSCYTSWETDGEVFAQHNHLWFDAEALEWKANVPVSEVAEDWNSLPDAQPGEV